MLPDDAAHEARVKAFLEKCVNLRKSIDLCLQAKRHLIFKVRCFSDLV